MHIGPQPHPAPAVEVTRIPRHQPLLALLAHLCRSRSTDPAAAPSLPACNADEGVAEALDIQLYFAVAREAASPPAAADSTSWAASPSLAAATADQAWAGGSGRGGLLLLAQAGGQGGCSAGLGPGMAAHTPQSRLGSAAQQQLDSEQGQQALNLSAQQQEQRHELVEQQQQALRVGPCMPCGRGVGLCLACGCPADFGSAAQEILHTICHVGPPVLQHSLFQTLHVTPQRLCMAASCFVLKLCTQPRSTYINRLILPLFPSTFRRAWTMRKARLVWRSRRSTAGSRLSWILERKKSGRAPRCPRFQWCQQRGSRPGSRQGSGAVRGILAQTTQCLAQKALSGAQPICCGTLLCRPSREWRPQSKRDQHQPQRRHQPLRRHQPRRRPRQWQALLCHTARGAFRVCLATGCCRLAPRGNTWSPL